ncbi:MAG: 7-carboxy-7-deazaguanine synthase QueE [Muribaculaceae bacterium]|nr:7-carboxy-7-deazaguanine synthase QueE [Muribaculaceae bacterium]
MKINEIFYSLQGEGYWTGTPAVFIRFSGCNLNCSFCDTEHENGRQMTIDNIISEVSKYPTQHIIFTGGEPTLQLNRELIDRLHALGKYLHMETNGSISLSDGIDKELDWITVSPKDAPVKIQRIDELKVVYHGAEQDMTRFESIPIAGPNSRYLQPCDVKTPETNERIISDAIEYIKRHPQWRLSLQTHKLLGIR